MVRVFDAFLYNGERELLEIRLHELEDVVDYHILVESKTTFSGEAKPLHFREDWMDSPLRRKFMGRVITVVVDDMPVGPDPWAREHWQRNAITRGLSLASHDDLVLMSDADEIPRPSAVAQLRSWKPPMWPVVFQQRCYYYYVNMQGLPPNDFICTTRCVPASMLRKLTPQEIRSQRSEDMHRLDDAGWMFSYLGGAERIRRKVRAFSHCDLYDDQKMSDESLQQCFTTGSDLFGRDYMKFQLVPIDESYPGYLRANLDKFKHLHAVPT